MTLDKDNPKRKRLQFVTSEPRSRTPQTRVQKIWMWIIFGAAAVLAIVSITILVESGTRLF